MTADDEAHGCDDEAVTQKSAIYTLNAILLGLEVVFLEFLSIFVHDGSEL